MQSEDFNQFQEDLLDIFGTDELYQKVKDFFVERPKETCKHEDCIDGICRDCGCEIKSIDFHQEWRYYGSESGRNPSRCVQTKEGSRGGIEKVFQEARADFPTRTIKQTEIKYNKVAAGTLRGQGRKALVAVCLFYTLRDQQDIRTSDELCTMFGITKQKFSGALNDFLAVYPEYRTNVLKPVDIIDNIISKNGIDKSHYPKIKKIVEYFYGADPAINRSSPQSIASACVYLYLCLFPSLKEKLRLNKTKFARNVGLSDITISKLVKKAAEIIGKKLEL